MPKEKAASRSKSATKTHSKSQSPRSKRAQDHGIFAELKKDHRQIEDYFKKLEKGEDKKVFTQLGEELSNHMIAEEKTFYAPLEGEAEVRELMLEGYEEHHAATMGLKEIESMSLDNEHWKAKIKVLMEMVEHHVDEEENQMFPAAKKLVDKQRAEQMAEDFQHYKESRGAHRKAA